MSICPHGNHELKIPNYAYNNVSSYGNTALTVTDCCGKGVYVKRVISFKIDSYNGTETEDDWGKEFTS